MDLGDDKPSVHERDRWHAAVTPLLASRSEQLWREHCDAVNATLVARWLPDAPCARLLKTDLWDEAMGPGLYPVLATHAAAVAGLDFTPSVLRSAQQRYPQLAAAVADVRALPFAAGAFDVVVSTSTLDHFARPDDIRLALGELHRVLAPRGRLLLTLDNRANPAVALRNALPFGLLHRLGLVPYPVGATCGPARLRRLLRAVGFDVLETTSLLHCPRVWAIATARRLQRRGNAAQARRFLERLERWERLARLPTRYLTGYFVGVHARKA